MLELKRHMEKLSTDMHSMQTTRAHQQSVIATFVSSITPNHATKAQVNLGLHKWAPNQNRTNKLDISITTFFSPITPVHAIYKSIKGYCTNGHPTRT